MVCIHCGSPTQVTNSRLQKRANQVWRRRQCLQCRAVFTTEEAADLLGAWAVKGPSGKLSPFSRDKLYISLYKSCEHRKKAVEDASFLCDTVISKLSLLVKTGTLDTKQIQQTALVALNRFDKAAGVH